MIARLGRLHVVGFLQLVTSGAVTALAFALLASRRTQIISEHVVVFLLLFVQWETLGVTIVKMGIDQLVFASVSRDSSLHFDLRSTVLWRFLPVAAVLSVLASALLNVFAAVALGVSILVDSYSLVLVAELNARRQFRLAALANLLNYPLFFVVLVLIAQIHSINRVVALAAFVTTSMARACWLTYKRVCPNVARVVVPQGFGRVGTQQAVNYLIFRLDQLCLSLPILIPTRTSRELFVATYLFLAKFPELAAGVLTLAGAVVLPAIVDDSGTQQTRRPFVQWSRLLAFFALVLGLSIVVYVRLWKGDLLSIAWTLPFFAHAFLIFPANTATYKMLTQGQIAGLIRNSIVSIAVGLVLLGLSVLGGASILFAWIVPTQLACFVVCFAVLPRGAPASLYRELVLAPAGGDGRSSQFANITR